ncbi:MAG TPA: recombinase RecA [Ignavibacteriales bacterium]|nr:recombinase RecA [Ignavibacteriales bacterium]
MAKEQKETQVVAGDQQAKMKVLEDTLNAIRKAHGKESIMKLSEGAIEPVEAIPTGILSLDYILGIGGFPRGRIAEIFGPEASGKTSICLRVIAEAQKYGGIAAFIDAEHALDINYAKKLGVDVNNLLLSQPDFGEQALEIVDALVRSNAVDVIVIDSVAALVPRSEIEGEMGDPTMGVQARLMSQALRKITSAISKSKTCVIFTNQLRSKIGVMFGNPETTTGGNALKFYASLRLDVRKTQTLKDGNEVIGSTAKVKIVKSKVAPPFKEVEIDFLYDEGISIINDVLRLAVENDIIKKSGAWFSYENERFQGQEQIRKKLKESPELLEKVKNEVKEKLGIIKKEEQ